MVKKTMFSALDNKLVQEFNRSVYKNISIVGGVKIISVKKIESKTAASSVRASNMKVPLDGVEALCPLLGRHHLFCTGRVMAGMLASMPEAHIWKQT